MRGKLLLTLGLAGAFTVGLARTAGAAEMITSTTTVTVPVVAAAPAGPTRLYSVPTAQTLGLGNNLVSANLFVGGVGLAPGPVGIGISGVSGNALNLQADMGLSPNFELDTGVGMVATTPWRGRLNLSGKWGWMQEGPAIVSLAGLAGGIVEIDANGVPNLGLQLGLPISKLFAFGGANYLGLSVVPNWNLGFLNAPQVIGGVAPGAFNYFGLGLGADLSVIPNLHVLADTNLGLPVAGLQTQSALGLRYDFTRDVTGDLFVGFNTGPALGLVGGPAALGLGTSWRF